MVFWMSFSDVLSRALVASSRKRVDAPLTSARAIAIRCFCPPDIFSPPAPTSVSSLSSRPFTKEETWASSIAFWRTSFVTPVVPEMMFSLILVAKSTGSWPTYPMHLRSALIEYSLIDVPFTRMLPCCAS
mmetsp:Transcript_96221/g.272431  ORF Transcript_96221/g.272431 Transcript_96221/m.272431 type:complete len:130 (-) Transcript_96221:922-1311(-)